MNGEKVLKKKIRDNGPISFNKFMQEALYGVKGFYRKGRGPRKDFSTAPEMHPAFSKVFAKLFQKTPFDSFIEIGVGEGYFAKNFVDFFKKKKKDINYFAIEKSELGRKKIKEKTPEAKVFSDLPDLSKFKGIVFTNELLDSFPVHIVEKKNGLKEVFVDIEDDEFVEVLKPAEKSVKEYFKWIDIDLPENFRTEVNLESLTWLEKINSILSKGSIITVDYGFEEKKMFSPKRSKGTLMCFKKGIGYENPYRDVGNRDITSKINFSALKKKGKDLGLINEGLMDQGIFLQAAGIGEIVERKRSKKEFKEFVSWFAPIRKLIMPSEMGKNHKVLIQSKNFKLNEIIQEKLSKLPEKAQDIFSELV